jgi:CrcB protein
VNVLLVIAGAAIGAPLRYLIDRGVQARHDGFFPWGTFTVNLIACLVLGFLTGAVTSSTVPHPVQILVGPGLCATLSTYSTFTYETLRLHENGVTFVAAANVIVSITAGLGAAFAGVALAHVLLN